MRPSKVGQKAEHCFAPPLGNPEENGPDLYAPAQAQSDAAPREEPPPLTGARKLLVYAPVGQGPGVKRAGKAYGERELAHVLARIEALSRVPESDAVKVLATYRAGLRPCEVAGLTKRTLLTATGEVKDDLEVTAATAKRSKPRTIPMHPQLKSAVEDLFAKYPAAERIAFSAVTDKGFRYQSAGTLYLWYGAIYLGAGLRGCTGMSGRRSFATNLARYAPLPLVQQALGHASLKTTGIYVEPTGDLASAINKLGSE